MRYYCEKLELEMCLKTLFPYDILISDYHYYCYFSIPDVYRLLLKLCLMVSGCSLLSK